MHLLIVMRPLRPLAFIGFLSVPAALFGQNLSLGLIGGGALTDAAQALGATPQTIGSTPHKDWIAGAVVEFRTASLLSFEIDGIYRQLSAMVTQVEPPERQTTSIRRTWLPGNFRSWQSTGLAQGIGGHSWRAGPNCVPRAI